MPDLSRSLGVQYLQQTKFDRETLMGRSRLRIEPAPLYKVYRDVERVALPEPELPQVNLEELFKNRRSRRSFAPKQISLQDLAGLLWAGQGLTAQTLGHELRTSPSAGGLYPVETYLCVQRVAELRPGLYHFNVRDFALELLEEGDFGPGLARAGLGQGFMARAAVDFCWTAVLRRNMVKYGHRGLRYVFMDAGHICQNVVLAAEALGLGQCPVGAFFDDEANALFKLDGQEESLIYFLSLGAKGD
ncbi:MAG: SagB/ThcOx family dehydrogenase [Desulfohalobiaceae bacterium]|nr:SagB/ThcOx family dehydrogenase [Desulfohalobiaceae bacterium]